MARLSPGDRAQRDFERRQDAYVPTWKDDATVGLVFTLLGALGGAGLGLLAPTQHGAAWGAGIGGAAGLAFGVFGMRR